MHFKNMLPIDHAEKVVNGQIKYIDNSSGHYLPQGLSAQTAAEKAFSKIGLDPISKYIEKTWYEDINMINGGVWRAMK